MAINNLSSLQLALADWVARTDLTNSVLNNFIDVAENEILHGLFDDSGRVIVPGLRVKAMQVRNATFPLTGEYTTLPTDFLGVRSVQLVGNPNVPLDFVTPSVFNATWLSTNNTSTPQAYSIIGDQLRVGPGASASSVLDIIYYEQPDNLVAIGTNWLCTKYPHAYLYGALRHLAIYVGMDSRLAFFQSAFITTLAAIHAQEKSTEFSGTALTSQTLGVTRT